VIIINKAIFAMQLVRVKKVIFSKLINIFIFIKKKIVVNSNKICSDCDSSCETGNCTLGNSNSHCTLCSDSSYYLDAGTCVLPSSCSSS